jgi:hypothetical protein
MKQQFLRINFGGERLAQIQLCNQIIDTYARQGLRLTLRQLYYQLVTQNAIPNQERAYKNLGKLVSDGRLAGLIDWASIEDRVRVPDIPAEFENLKDLVEAAIMSYRLPRWKGQDAYVELWVEKDALSGVLVPLASEFHVTLMVNRGYSSQSAMYDAARRFGRHRSRNRVLLYLGDHDPSGEDMVRDIGDRLTMLCSPVNVYKVALTFDQVSEYQPPPNPTKLTDSRAAGYIAKYGDECWEVDALPPDVLQELIRDAVSEHLDRDLMDEVVAREDSDKERLLGFVEGV